MPLFDPLTHIVFSTAKSDVRHVFVGGRQVVRDGALTGLDLDAIARRGGRAGPAHRRERRMSARVRAPGSRRWPRSGRGPGAPAEIALILGSGLGGLADAVERRGRDPLREIDGFPVSTAPGHAGRLVDRRAARPAGRR